MKTFLVFCLTFLTMYLSAQPEMHTRPTEDQKDVIKVIQLLFDGMRKGDSTLVRICFHREAQLHTTFFNDKGEAVLREESVERFIQAVGTPHEEIWDERFESIDVKVDDNLAVAWVPYVFHSDETPLHQGVNAFQLVKTNEGWKIIQLTDTRRKMMN
jgi:hypothetical protein